MTDTNKQYQAPRIRELDRIVALLQLWAQWRRSDVRVVGLRPSPRSNLGPLIKRRRQEVDLWGHDRQAPEIFDDALMCQVDRAVAGLEATLKAVVMQTYVKGRGDTAERRARRLHCSERAYWYRLNRAHETIDRKVDWNRAEGKE